MNGFDWDGLVQRGLVRRGWYEWVGSDGEEAECLGLLPGGSQLVQRLPHRPASPAPETKTRKKPFLSSSFSGLLQIW